MAKVSGFADEISPDLSEQIDGLTSLGVKFIALRGCFKKNVMDWTVDERDRIKKALDAAGIGVGEIGSPVGKTPIDEPFEQAAASLDHAVKLAQFFETPNVRMFSFYPPKTGDKANWLKTYRDEVLKRLNAFVRQAAGSPVMLMLENEAELYGDQPAECLDIFHNVRGANFAMAFDPANFVSRTPLKVYEQAWTPLRKFVRHFHVKDYVPGAKTACPAGQGIGDLPQILADLARENYEGFLTLEPHLAQAGQFGGFSGLQRFKVAADALFALCGQTGFAIQ
jgi:sugar phosphate isomerase/epimerase